MLIKCFFILSSNWRYIPKSFFCTFSDWRRHEKCIFTPFSGWRLYKKSFSPLSRHGECIKNHLHGRLRIETVYKSVFDPFSVWRLYVNSFSTFSPYRDCLKNSLFIHSSTGATPIYSSTCNEYSCNSNIGYF